MDRSRPGIWLVTGPPAIGKSTVVARVVLSLKSEGYVVGGCETEEKREKGLRTGFSIVDLGSGKKGTLASLAGVTGPRVGKYRVSLEGLLEVGAPSLRSAAAGSELIVIDEIGPMELISPDFKRAIEVCFASGKPILAIVHEGMKDSSLEELTRNPKSEFFAVTLQNRDALPDRIFQEIRSYLGPIKGG